MLRKTMSFLTFTKRSHAPEYPSPRIIKYVSNTFKCATVYSQTEPQDL